jgi:hypothetical protein
MTRVSLRLLSCLLVLSLIVVAAGRVYAQASTDVFIRTTAIVGTTLTVKGVNFGAGAPNVMVGEATVTLTRNSDTELVGETPALGPGMYSVKVVRDASAGGTAVSSLFIR